jgi:hypothetical protein
MHRLRFSDEADGGRAGRVRPRLANVYRAKCKRVQRHLIDSTVTEAWLEPQLFIKGQHGNAVTFEVRDGRLIPSQPVKTV